MVAAGPAANAGLVFNTIWTRSASTSVPARPGPCDRQHPIRPAHARAAPRKSTAMPATPRHGRRTHRDTDECAAVGARSLPSTLDASVAPGCDCRYARDAGARHPSASWPRERLPCGPRWPATHRWNFDVVGLTSLEVSRRSQTRAWLRNASPPSAGSSTCGFIVSGMRHARGLHAPARVRANGKTQDRRRGSHPLDERRHANLQLFFFIVHVRVQKVMSASQFCSTTLVEIPSRLAMYLRGRCSSRPA